VRGVICDVADPASVEDAAKAAYEVCLAWALDWR